MYFYEITNDPSQEIISKLNQYGLKPNAYNLIITNYPKIIKNEIDNYHNSLKTKNKEKIFSAIEKIQISLSDPYIMKEISKEKSDSIIQNYEKEKLKLMKNNMSNYFRKQINNRTF